MYSERIRLPSLHDKLMSAEAAAELVKEGMTVGLSGFASAGDAKVVPKALAERSRKHPLRLTIIAGASLGGGLDGIMVQSGMTVRRIPFQSDPILRQAINAGEVMFIDYHLSIVADLIRHGQLKAPDIAIIEASAITEQGHIIPTASIGNSAIMAQLASQVIIELNPDGPNWEGIHDVYLPELRPGRQPIPVINPQDRAGCQAIAIKPEQIAAIVISDKFDVPASILPPDTETQAIADHLISFFMHEIDSGRLSNRLAPLQIGVGSIANAVMSGLVNAPFNDLVQYSEVLQDSTCELMDAGKLKFASTAGIVLSADWGKRVFGNLDKYRDRLVIRPQEGSNNPELIRRLGIISINTALEFDIYGNVNSTHVAGSHMMNGIGGSGDFARNAHLAIFVTKSIAKGGAISSVVPMVSHVDHTEHDVDVLVTEQGLADLRGLAPRERARTIIDKCVHPNYREAVNAYFEAACAGGGHTPHCLDKAFNWYGNLQKWGYMLGPVEAPHGEVHIWEDDAEPHNGKSSYSTL